MSAKRKATSAKEKWEAMRARYTWHLRPPFKDEFDRSHWWKGQPDAEIEPAAALYELIRRHPLVGEGLLKRIPSPAARVAIYANDPNCPPAVVEGRLTELTREVVAGLHEPPSLYWTCRLGLKSWVKLDYTERRNWEFEVGYLKGLDFRDEDLQCRSINQLADWKIRDQRRAALGDNVKGIKRGLEMGKIINADLAAKPPTVEEWEAAIGYRAVEAYRQGYLLLAVAPGLESDKAALLMQKVYGSAQCKFASPKQRARRENWLPLIASFEDDETSANKAKSQIFARYRRALDGIRFT